MRGIDAAPVAVAILAVVVPAIVVTHSPRVPRAALAFRRVIPKAEVPAVEPVRFVDLSPDDARAYNADIPFSTEPKPAARPFRFAGPADDLDRARDCMAAGVLYEAGDDTTGEKAVAQVVLNRLRHPAFPKTICGVVFEGQDRATGCQFSFTCDGAMRRWHPAEAAWRRARQVADAALAGAVYRPVGYATHYHTDWVVPYWQSSLDKIAAVHTHLFFRWSGWWGTPPAFDRHPEGREPLITQLAAISDAHRPAGIGVSTDVALAEAWPDPLDDAVRAGPTDATGTFLVTLSRSDPPDAYPAQAVVACGTRPSCRYLGWTDRNKTAAALPLTDQQRATLTFSYSRDRPLGFEAMAWDCQQAQRADPAQCMQRPTDRAAAGVSVPTPIGVALSGVRRSGPVQIKDSDPKHPPLDPAKP